MAKMDIDIENLFSTKNPNDPDVDTTMTLEDFLVADLSEYDNTSNFSLSKCGSGGIATGEGEPKEEGDKDMSSSSSSSPKSIPSDFAGSLSPFAFRPGLDGMLSPFSPNERYDDLFDFSENCLVGGTGTPATSVDGSIFGGATSSGDVFKNKEKVLEELLSLFSPGTGVTGSTSSFEHRRLGNGNGHLMDFNSGNDFLGLDQSQASNPFTFPCAPPPASVSNAVAASSMASPVSLIPNINPGSTSMLQGPVPNQRAFPGLGIGSQQQLSPHELEYLRQVLAFQSKQQQPQQPLSGLRISSSKNEMTATIARATSNTTRAVSMYDLGLVEARGAQIKTHFSKPLQGQGIKSLGDGSEGANNQGLVQGQGQDQKHARTVGRSQQTNSSSRPTQIGSASASSTSPASTRPPSHSHQARSVQPFAQPRSQVRPRPSAQLRQQPSLSQVWSHPRNPNAHILQLIASNPSKYTYPPTDLPAVPLRGMSPFATPGEGKGYVSPFGLNKGTQNSTQSYGEKGGNNRKEIANISARGYEYLEEEFEPKLREVEELMERVLELKGKEMVRKVAIDSLAASSTGGARPKQEEVGSTAFDSSSSSVTSSRRAIARLPNHKQQRQLDRLSNYSSNTTNRGRG